MIRFPNIFSIVLRNPTCSFLASISHRNLQISASRFNVQLKLTFASTRKAYYTDKVIKQVEVDTTSGLIGVVAEHVPLLGCLKPGILSVTEEDDTVKKYLVSSGIVSINSDSTIQILAEEAATHDELDMEVVNVGLAKSEDEVRSKSVEEELLDAKISAEVYGFLSSEMKTYKS